MVVVKVMLAQNPEDARTFLFLTATESSSFTGWSTPELSDFGRISVCFELVGSILEYLVKLAWPDAHIIRLYNTSHNCLHLLLFFDEFHH